MRVRLTTNDAGDVLLESPYRDFEPVREEFKSAIPRHGRRWDGEQRRWVIGPLYADDLLDFLAQHGARIQDDRQRAHDTPRLPMPGELQNALTALHLAPSAPLCVAEGAFRALSKHYHPDAGGAVEDFQRVNDAIATIRHYLNPLEDVDDAIPF